MSRSLEEHLGHSVAIVGMAGRFPGADSVEELWHRLLAGEEGIRRFDDEELAAAGTDPAELGEGWVRAGAVLSDVDHFDAEHFGYSPREAALMDPQHRLALECAWQALEDAGRTGAAAEGLTGVYASCGISTYLLHLLAGGDDGPGLDSLQLTLGNDKDYLATRISYKLNLKGPSLSVQTACSSSLVAVHLACQSLLDFECDQALAGGVSVRAPQPLAYRYQEGSILSPDGRCRAFDAGAGGTVFGNGVGFVVLRRLEDALADGDRVVAVIRGTAINNDGSDKVGYTAPSVEGQSAVIRRAVAVADVDPSSIGYVEAHGTGTPMGDPLEVAALAQAFGPGLPPGSCWLGAVKTNLGHLDAAAGVTGLIKAALVLERGEIPPSLHQRSPNPEIDFASTPFRVVAEPVRWRTAGEPRRAGVSSFGIGGTNAHAVLEEPPAMEAPAEGPVEAPGPQVLRVSARTAGALAEACRRLAGRLADAPDLSLADVAFTLHRGRRALPYRWSGVAADPVEAAAVLEAGAEAASAATATAADESRPPVAFLFPGQGSQYPDMGLALRRGDGDFATFGQQWRRCLEILDELNCPLGRSLDPDTRPDDADAALAETEMAQPALFTVSYALARQWMAWGVEPAVMLGHSVGELVAACLAGVFTLPDALGLAVTRGRLMQAQPRGAMLAVAASREELQGRLPEGVTVSAVNAPRLTVVGGPEEAVTRLRRSLEEDSVACRPLHTSHAFHTPLMEGAVEPFREAVAAVERSAPRIPILSSVTGAPAGEAELTDPGYWADQIRHPVQFAAAAGELARRHPSAVPLEVGPGRSLKKLCAAQELAVVASLPGAGSGQPADRALLAAVGRLWERGLDVDPVREGAQAGRRRVALPTYPFERQRHWIEGGDEPRRRRGGDERRPVERWFHRRTWRQASLPGARLPEPRSAGGETPAGGACLILGDLAPASALAERLRAAGGRVVEVRPGEGFAAGDDGSYTVRPGEASDFSALFDHLAEAGVEVHRAVHAMEADRRPGPALESFYLLAQALGSRGQGGGGLLVAVAGLHRVTGDEELAPGGALVAAAARVLALESPALPVALADVAWASKEELEGAAAFLGEELDALGSGGAAAAATDDDRLRAYRHGLRWDSGFQPVTAPEPGEADDPLRREGVYLVTGGLGGLGRELARRLAAGYGARLVLVSRSGRASGEDGEDLTDALVAELEEAGGRVLVAAADVADAEAMARVVGEARQRFGPLDGVFHLAGVPGGGLVQTRELERVEDVLRPKVAGLEALLAVLADAPPPWVVLFSSITAVSGALGQADYCAANAYLDAAAEAAAGGGLGGGRGGGTASPRLLSIAWDAWRYDSWQQGAGALPPVLQERLKESRERFGIRFDEGFEVLRRALASGHPRLVVSTRDLGTTLGVHRVALDRLMGQSEDATARPAIDASDGELEAIISAVWREVLGREEIGRHETFVDLGGHSLLAIQLVSRLTEELGAEVPLRAIFEHPTVASLAAFLGGSEAAAPEDRAQAELERRLAEVESLSEEEVERRLAELAATAGVEESS